MVRRMSALGMSTVVAAVGLGMLAAPANAAPPAVEAEPSTSVTEAALQANRAGDICLGNDHTVVGAGAHGVPPRVYNYKDYETPFRNCWYGQPFNARVDIALYPDTPCMTVQPGQTVVFRYHVEWMPGWSPEPGPRNVVAC